MLRMGRQQSAKEPIHAAGRIANIGVTPSPPMRTGKRACSSAAPRSSAVPVSARTSTLMKRLTSSSCRRAAASVTSGGQQRRK